MTAWSTEEEIVVIYYASRRIKSGTIEELIAKKCHPKVRSIKQITHKSSRLKKACAKRRSGMVNPFLAPDREWNRKLADQWIVSKMEKAELDQLLEFDGETAAIIGENNDLNEFVDVMALDYGELDYGELDYGELDYGELDYGELDYGDLPEQSEEVDQPEKDEQGEEQNGQSGAQEVGNADMVPLPSAIWGGFHEFERLAHPSSLQQNGA